MAKKLKKEARAPFAQTIRAELVKARESVPLVPGPDQVGIRAADGKLAEREEKKNFAQALSDALALKFADGLRYDFPGTLPMRDPDDGSVVRGNESPARTLKGVKKLDVNFSTVQLGLGLGVSIKTLNFRDPKSKRYTKNVTRIDNELRAEAGDYHERQPFSVLAALVFIPNDAANDGAISSFAHAVLTLRYRTGRGSHRDAPDLFERLYIALYEAADGARLGEVMCFDVTKPPPKTGIPKLSDLLTLDDVLKDIQHAFYERNVPKKIFADSDEATDRAAELDELAATDPDLFASQDDGSE